MKQVTTFLFLLLTAAAFGQASKDVKTDTTYLVWDVAPDDWTGGDDSIFFETRTITYISGRQETITEPVGDTATTVNYFTNRSVDLNRQLSQAAAITIQRAAVVRAVRVSDKALTGAGIGSVYVGLDSLFWREYLNPSANNFQQAYTAVSAGTNYAATMRRMANGTIRLSFNSVNYRAYIYSDTWLRVRDFPIAGQNTDLFRTGPKRWESIAGANDGARIVPALVLRKN